MAVAGRELKPRSLVCEFDAAVVEPEPSIRTKSGQLWFPHSAV